MLILEPLNQRCVLYPRVFPSSNLIGKMSTIVAARLLACFALPSRGEDSLNTDLRSCKSRSISLARSSPGGWDSNHWSKEPLTQRQSSITPPSRAAYVAVLLTVSIFPFIHSLHARILFSRVGFEKYSCYLLQIHVLTSNTTRCLPFSLSLPHIRALPLDT